MQGLKHYLNNAKEYMDGGGVEPFLMYYRLHEKELETVWEGMISSLESQKEFSELVEKYGLYILIDNGYRSACINVQNGKKEAEFGLRIFNFDNHNVGVLKCCNIPNTAV